MMRTFFALLTALCLSAPAFASDTPKDPEAWAADLELGLVVTSGNTSTKTFNSKAKAVKDLKTMRTTAEASAFSNSDKNSTTAEKYTASIQEDYKYTERDYLFGRIGFSTDRFSGFKRRLSESAGYGRDILKDEVFDWHAEIGVGLRQTTLTNNTKKSETIGRAATLFKWVISDSATFSQELTTEGGSQGFLTNSVTALKNKINGNLSSKIALAVKHDSKVPAGTKKVDTETTFNLVFSY